MLLEGGSIWSWFDLALLLASVVECIFSFFSSSLRYSDYSTWVQDGFMGGRLRYQAVDEKSTARKDNKMQSSLR